MNKNITNIDKLTAFFAIAEKMSSHSPCERLKVGAVSIDSETANILFLSCNDTKTRGEHQCNPDGCSDILHAESQLLKYAYKQPFGIVVTHEPCLQCAQEIANSKCEFLFFRNNYTSKTGSSGGISLLRKSNVLVMQYLG